MLAIKQTFKWITYILILLLILITLVIFIITLFIFPNINEYKDDIANKITAKTGQNISIGHIDTDWDNLSPKIIIKSMDIYDAQNQSALHLENIHGTFSWLSIPLMHLHMSELSVNKPTLHIQRKQDGVLYVAGIPMVGNGKPTLANWLLKQASAEVRDASITWQDDFRQAPPLSLNHFNFRLSNPAWRQIIGEHQFSMDAIPSVGTQHAIKIRGNFYGDDFSQLARWRGNIKLQAKQVDLTAWKPWVDYPMDINTGAGETEITVGFSNKQINQLIAKIALKDLSALIVDNKPPLEASSISGLVTWERTKQKTTITAQKLNLAHQGKQYLSNGSSVIYQTKSDGANWTKASINAEQLDVAILDKVNASIDLPKAIEEHLNALAPKGELKEMKVSFEGNASTVKHYQVKSQFDNISIKASKEIPGIAHFSGDIDADEENGQLSLNTKDALLDIKQMFRWPIPIDTANGKITWRQDQNKIKILTKGLILENKHAKGTLNVNYQLTNKQNSYLDLSGQFNHGDAQYASYYYPHILNEAAKNWLDKAIIGGKVSDIQVRVKGNLKDFPFVDNNNKPNPKLGIFKVAARLDHAQLQYGENWPKIENMGLDLLFTGNSMLLNADKGNMMGVNIKSCKAAIPMLKTKRYGEQILTIDSIATTPLSEGIKFINASPVKTITQGFTQDLQTDGNGQLKLGLSIPLKDVNNTRFNGEFNIKNGTIYTNERMGIPEINNILGSIQFNESSLTANNMEGSILGGPVQLTVASAPDKTITINAKGTATDRGVQKAFPNLISNHLFGTAAWRADIKVKQPLLELNITSDLKGMALTLPAPFSKSAEEVASLLISKVQNQATEDTIDINFNQLFSAKILRKEHDNTLKIDRGEIAFNQPATIPKQQGLFVKGHFDYLNADEWLEAFNQANTDKQNPNFPVNGMMLEFDNLDIFSRSLHALSLQATPKANTLDLLVNSSQLTGNIQWHAASAKEPNGKIIASLSKLHIPANHDEDTTERNEVQPHHKQYPALDIQAEDFKLGEKALGKLEIKAYEDNENWVIQQLVITNPDTTLSADGTWHNWSRNAHTNLNFSLSANDIGSTLKRFGQADTVKGGVALIVGHLAWNGSPHQFKKAGLNGEFTIGASKGQILKVQPGVGRLFGLLTLQSLPRRLTLDFRDLFSEGFAFDEISGTASINNGIMRSDDFFMTGPAAETNIKGEIDLNAETQNLHVRVEPHVSDTLSLAALAGGPIAGVAAFVAQKILKDPLNKIAQSEYIIEGTWDNPVEKGAPNKKQEKKISPLNAQQH